jgi:hydroxyethylthiazole kinase-like uncharacterized protein yjeF
MTEILTSAQMRATEAAAIASGRVTGLALMERAGAAVIEAIFETWPERRCAPDRALVLCGPGNNGGDGFVVARLLHDLGWQVDVFFFGTAATLPPDAKTNHDRWAALGPIHPAASFPAVLASLPPAPLDLFIDAAFGIGLTRPLPAEIRSFFLHNFGSELTRNCVAIDIPSGLCADTGRVLRPADYPADHWPALDGLACEADLTVTFHRAKPGHLTGEGPRFCGQLVVKDIGL